MKPQAIAVYDNEVVVVCFEEQHPIDNQQWFRMEDPAEMVFDGSGWHKISWWQRPLSAMERHSLGLPL